MKQPDNYPNDRKKAVSIAWQCIAPKLQGNYPAHTIRSVHSHIWRDGYELAKLLEHEGASIHAQDVLYLDQLPVHISSMLKKQVWDWIHQHPDMKPNLRRGQTVWFQTVRDTEHLAATMVPNIGHVPLKGTIQDVSHQGLDQCRVKLLDSPYCYIAPWWDSDTEVGIQPICNNETPFLAKPQPNRPLLALTNSHVGFSHH